MKKTLTIIFACLLCTISAKTQDKDASLIADKTIDYSSSDFGFSECGNRLLGSQTYGYTLPAVRVIKIVDANSIVVRKVLENNRIKKYAVNLIGINPNINKKNIVAFLKDNLLNQLVSITGNKWKSGAIVDFWTKQGNISTEVNLYLIGKGFAEYQDFDEYYIVPSRTPCVYKKAEEIAKEAKLGIWLKN